MIRPFLDSDIERARQIHKDNQLPENCFPDLTDPLILVKAVVEEDGRPVVTSFLRGTSEVFVLVDHTFGTPEERWKWLQELTQHMKEEAYRLGLSEMTAWIPPDIDKSFGRRLIELGFQRSPWQSYTLMVE
jgi:hypothetical protein